MDLSPLIFPKTLIIAVNEASGRAITIRSPLRLRPLPGKGCEFCNQPFNRGTGAWTCPYCGRRFGRSGACPPVHAWTFQTLILAVNEATGRLINIRSPLRLRPLRVKGCEFCNQPYNRGTGPLKCQYCGRRFGSA